MAAERWAKWVTSVRLPDGAKRAYASYLQICEGFGAHNPDAAADMCRRLEDVPDLYLRSIEAGSAA